jgi:cytochrome c oxidase assembly protein subunit 15
MTNNRKLKNFSLFVLIYTVLVILFGAFVRATGSGAGCGAHWPTCQGKIVPSTPVIETIIEFTHRLTSGFSLIFVVLLFIFIFRVKAGRYLKRAVSLALFFTLFEAILGAGLVLFQLVGDNDSIARAIVISIHLLNTFLLLANLVLVWEWLAHGEPQRLAFTRKQGWWLVISTVLILILSMSGAITALGDTLFPSATIAEGLQQDLTPGRHFLIELRVYHPLVAVLAVVTFMGLIRFVFKGSLFGRKKKNADIVQGLFLAQLFLGGINVLLLAPLWMQIVHLLFADLIWINYIIFVELVLTSDS